MLILGDVVAIGAGLVGLAVTLWALILTLAVLLDQRRRLAAHVIRQSAWGSMARGAVLAVLAGPIGLRLLAGVNPGGKLLGWVVLLTLCIVAAIGASGLAGLAADRIRQMAPGLSEFGALSRASLLIVLAALVPFVGWFVVGPALFLTALGAGARRIRVYAVESNEAVA